MNEAQQITVNVGADYWWVSPVVIALVGLGGFFSVYWQLRVQHRNARKIQGEHLRQQLHLEIYDDIVGKLEISHKALSQFMNSATFFPISLRTRIKVYETTNLDHWPSDDTMERFLREWSEASGGVIGVMWVMEKYEIMLPEFQDLREQLGKRNERLTEKNTLFHGKILPFLLPDFPKDRTGVPQFPDDTWFSELDTIISNLKGVILGLQADLKDLLTLGQNQLLGGLSDSRVPPRMPSDATIEAPEGDNNQKADG